LIVLARSEEEGIVVEELDQIQVDVETLKCINSRAITQIIQNSLNRSIIVDIIDINVKINPF
jgi:hypothetical protein